MWFNFQNNSYQVDRCFLKQKIIAKYVPAKKWIEINMRGQSVSDQLKQIDAIFKIADAKRDLKRNLHGRRHCKDHILMGPALIAGSHTGLTAS